MANKNDKPKSGFAQFISDYGKFLRDVKEEFNTCVEPLRQVLLRPRKGTYERLLRFSLLSHLILASWFMYQSGASATAVFNWVILPFAAVFLGVVMGGLVFILSYFVWTFGHKDAAEVNWPTTGALLYTVWLLPGIIPVYGLILLDLI